MSLRLHFPLRVKRSFNHETRAPQSGDDRQSDRRRGSRWEQSGHINLLPVEIDLPNQTFTQVLPEVGTNDLLVLYIVAADLAQLFEVLRSGLVVVLHLALELLGFGPRLLDRASWLNLLDPVRLHNNVSQSSAEALRGVAHARETSPQKEYFRAISISRDSSALDICPKMDDPNVVAGLLKLARFSALKN